MVIVSLVVTAQVSGIHVLKSPNWWILRHTLQNVMYKSENRMTPATHSQMYRRIAAGHLIWKMLSDLRIIFPICKGIRNILVRSITACCNP